MKKHKPDFMYIVKRFRAFKGNEDVEKILNGAVDTFEMSLYITLKPIIEDLCNQNAFDCDYKKPSEEHIAYVKEEARADGREYDEEEAYETLNRCDKCGNMECGLPQLFKFYEELLKHVKKITKRRKKENEARSSRRHPQKDRRLAESRK